MKYFLAILLIIFLSCEEIMTTQNTKPTVAEFNPPAGTNVELPPSIVLENGFFDGDPDNPLYAKYFNALRKESFRVADYLLQTTRNIYIDIDDGDDDDGDGSSAMPYQSIPKAMSMIASNAYTVIRIKKSGTYLFNSDVAYTNMKVAIIEEFGVSAKVKIVSYTKSGENWLYMLNMNGINYFSIVVDEIEIDAPNDTGVDWYQYATFINVQSGLSIINFEAVTKTAFSATGATGSDYPSLITGSGTVMVTGSGTIDTENKGYVLDARGRLQFANNFAGIDNVAYSAKGLLYQNQILSTGDLGGTIGTFAIYINGGSLSAPATLPIAEDETDANIKTAVQDWLNSMIKSGSIVATVTSTRGALDVITSLTIEIGGVYAGKALFSGLYWIGGGDEGYFEEIQAPKPLGYNVITN